MTTQTKTQLATEKMQNDFTLFNELSKRLDKLRQDTSPAKIKESGIDQLVFEHTGIKIKFEIVNINIINAYMSPPLLDRNHPFWSNDGINIPYTGKDSHKLGVARNKLIEVFTDDSNYTVGGAWSKIEITLVIYAGVFKNKNITGGMIAACFLHELGHAYTYFSLFGKLSRKNFLISEAVKDIMGATPLEKRVQVLTVLEKDLDIFIKEKEKLLQLPTKIRADTLESIIITSDPLVSTTTSVFQNYDIRGIEQIADQFALYHGAGADLAKIDYEILRAHGSAEIKGTRLFVIGEVIKSILVVFLGFYNPILTIIGLLLLIPGHKVYDSPVARVELYRKQIIQSLREFKNDASMKKTLLDQIKVIEDILSLMEDRRTFYTLIYQTISPRGRSMYRQEVFMKSVENLLYNDTYFNAAKFGALANEI